MCSVNSEKRILHARYHSAAHFIRNVVEKLYPPLKAIKGHTFPDQAYVKFSEINFSEMPKYADLDDTSMVLTEGNIEK